MNKAYFDKRRERINQRLQILYARPDFQTDVTEFRKRWNIPGDGLKTEQDNSAWRSWLENETNKYLEQHRQEYHKQMQDLLKQNKHIESDDLNKAFNAKVPRNAFRLEVLRFLKKYKIPFQWEEMTRRYLLFNNTIEERMPINSITLQENWDFDLGGWQLTLLLSADTTLDDVKAIWPLVKEQQAKLYDHESKKFQPIPNLKIDERVYELKKQRMTHSEIADQIVKEFNLPDYTYKEVSESLRRHKKRLGLL
jgi:hypothetical protein